MSVVVEALCHQAHTQGIYTRLHCWPVFTPKICLAQVPRHANEMRAAAEAACLQPQFSGMYIRLHCCPVSSKICLAQAAQHAAEMRAAVEAACLQPRARKPSKRAWLDGPFAPDLQILSDMALGRPLSNAQQSILSRSLQVGPCNEIGPKAMTRSCCSLSRTDDTFIRCAPGMR